jgi:pimeloyl-ACP methyl ester carboxylesterase
VLWRAGLRVHDSLAQHRCHEGGKRLRHHDEVCAITEHAHDRFGVLVDVRLLILVAPMIPSPGESPGAWWANTGQTTARRRQDEREGRDPDAALDVMTIFMHDVPPDIVAEAFARGEPRQSDTPFAEPWPLEQWPNVPTKVLAGRHDRLFPLEFMRRLALERLNIVADVIDTGHLPALSRSDELVRRLETYRLHYPAPPA